MHFTETVYRNPYWPTYPLFQVTQGCTHNSCKFCTMYKDVDFKLQPAEWIEEDLKEIAASYPDAKTIQLLSANQLVMSYDRLAPILETINKYLPEMEYIYTQGRVSDLKNKTAEQLKALKDLGMKEISLGVESGDDPTLNRVNKGYNSNDILEQCAKLDEAGIDYWMTFLNGIAGRERSYEHAVHSAEIFIFQTSIYYFSQRCFLGNFISSFHFRISKLFFYFALVWRVAQNLGKPQINGFKAIPHKRNKMM